MVCMHEREAERINGLQKRKRVKMIFSHYAAFKALELMKLFPFHSHYSPSVFLSLPCIALNPRRLLFPHFIKRSPLISGFMCVWCTHYMFCKYRCPVFPPDLTPEEKARGLARAIRKQTGEVKERWERLKGHMGGWHNQVEQALERLQELQSSMDQLDLRLTQAEEAKATWQPVGDLLIDSLQDHIDKTMVRPIDGGYCLHEPSYTTMMSLLASQELRHFIPMYIIMVCNYQSPNSLHFHNKMVLDWMMCSDR